MRFYLIASRSSEWLDLAEVKAAFAKCGLAGADLVRMLSSASASRKLVRGHGIPCPRCRWLVAVAVARVRLGAVLLGKGDDAGVWRLGKLSP